MIIEMINKLRKEKGITIADLAEKIGASHVTLQRNLVEGSKLKVEDMEAIARVLGEKEFYAAIIEELQTLEFVKMDIQNGATWGIFLVNDTPQMVGYVENLRLILYIKESDSSIYNRKKLEKAIGPGVELEDIKEDNNIVNMWVYQYRRKSGD